MWWKILLGFLGFGAVGGGVAYALMRKPTPSSAAPSPKSRSDLSNLKVGTSVKLLLSPTVQRPGTYEITDRIVAPLNDGGGVLYAGRLQGTTTVLGFSPFEIASVVA